MKSSHMLDTFTPSDRECIVNIKKEATPKNNDLSYAK